MNLLIANSREFLTFRLRRPSARLQIRKVRGQDGRDETLLQPERTDSFHLLQSLREKDVFKSGKGGFPLKEGGGGGVR